MARVERVLLSDLWLNDNTASHKIIESDALPALPFISKYYRANVIISRFDYHKVHCLARVLSLRI